MKNWAIQALLYDFNPSPHNYIKSRWYHFHFCKKEDPTITAALYLDNLKEELALERAKQSSVNKKSLTLSVFKKILQNEKARQELVVLFENRNITLNEEIKEFLNRVAPLIHERFDKEADNLASGEIFLLHL